MISNKFGEGIRKKYIIKLVILSVLLLILKPTGFIAVAGEEVCQPISVTGFNEDVVAESLRLITQAQLTTTAAMDNASNVYYTSSLSKNKKFSQPGLPDDRIINSEATKEVKYQLQPYNNNNVLLFSSNSASGTLTLNKDDNGEASYEKIYLLAASGSGICDMDITIKFTDGSSTTYSKIRIQDWYYGTNYAIRNIGRLDRSSGKETGEPLDSKGNGGNPRMYETVLELNKEDQKKSVSLIQFKSDIKWLEGRRTGIFAVSGKPTDKRPKRPVLGEVTDILTNSAVLNWYDAEDAKKYVVEVALDSDFSRTSILKDYNNKEVDGITLNLENLDANTFYYYRVRAKNDYGESPNSEIGIFKTLPYEISIIKHPDSIIVEENNINESLDVSVVTDSKKELKYDWYLSSDEFGNNIILKETTGSIFTIPKYLLSGNYYVYCEVYGDDVKTVKTNVAKLTVEVIYNIDLSWGQMQFEFDAGKKWNADTHSYEDIYSWKRDSVDGENNKITISNHSSGSLPMSIEYVSKEGVFNNNFDADTSVQGRFYDNNEDALIASGYLGNLTEELNFGSNVIEKEIETDKWIDSPNSKKLIIYFAFSGMPDLSVEEEYLSDSVQKFTSDNESIEGMIRKDKLLRYWDTNKFYPSFGFDRWFDLKVTEINRKSLSEYQIVGSIYIKFKTND